jgi:serine phosphatase RsbU (regulator of sigma subunit)
VSRERLIQLALVVVTLLIGVVDYHVGLTVQLSLWYALVILAGGWTGGVYGVMWTTVMCSCVDLGATFVKQPSLRADLLYLSNDALTIVQWVVLGLGAAAQRAYLRQVVESRAQLHETQQRLEQALRDARAVQLALLHSDLSGLQWVEGSVRFEVAFQLGGDFFDVRNLSTGTLMVLADVSGKGPSAALVVSVLRGLLEETAPRCTGPANLLSMVQERLVPFLPDSMFVTCLAAMFDGPSRRLTCCNAGHEPAFLCQNGMLTEVVGQGLPLGVAPEIPLGEAAYDVAPDDVLLAYTDGLTNAPTVGGGRLGEDPVRQVLLAKCSRPLGELTGSLFELTGGRQDDDVVVLALRFRGSPALEPKTTS